MKTKDIVNIVVCGLIVAAGVYFMIKALKWLWSFLKIGSASLLVFTYIFAPIIIIVLLVMILVKLGKKR